MELDIIKKKQVDENSAIKLDTSNNKNRRYKMKVICNSTVYTKE